MSDKDYPRFEQTPLNKLIQAILENRVIFRSDNWGPYAQWRIIVEQKPTQPEQTQ